MAEHNAFGIAAEDAACRFLVGRGCLLLERNYRSRGGEIDLIMSDGPVLAFVEVRARRSADFMHPVESIGPGKQRRIIAAARHYLAEKRLTHAALVRFDVICIQGHPENGEVEWIKRAFDA